MANIMIICAHPDDEILGAGGTIAAYAEQGHDITTVIISKGEGSHPWIAKKNIHDTRIKESLEAGKIVGATRTYFLDVADGKFKKELQRPEIKKRLEDLMKLHKPHKIFTHAQDDILYGHHVVYKTVMQIVKDLKTRYTRFNPQVWGFNIWAMNVRQRNKPMLVVDISKTFHKKIQAIKCFHTQKIALYQLTPFVYAKALLNGFSEDTRYAENFVKLI